MSGADQSSNVAEVQVSVQIQLPKKAVESLGRYVGKKGETIEERIVKLVLRHIQHLQASEEIELWLERGYSPITEVVPMGNFSLHLKFDDGVEGDLNMEPTIQRGGVFSSLAQFDFFQQVKIARNGEILLWPNDIQLDAGNLYWTIFYEGKNGWL